MFEDARVVEALSLDQEQKLAQVQAQIRAWVTDANSAKKLNLQIESASVKKILDKFVTTNFPGITTNWSKTNPKVALDKGKKFVQGNFCDEMQAAEEEKKESDE